MRKQKKPIKAIVCDFDGTFSTLRAGWEAVMRQMMVKYLGGAAVSSKPPYHGEGRAAMERRPYHESERAAVERRPYHGGERVAMERRPYHEAEKWVDAFIDETTGVQTILQMKGFVAELQRRKKQGGALAEGVSMPSDDPWFYKREYNDLLMATVARKRQEVIEGKVPRSVYLIPGALAFLQNLRNHGVRIYFASGTDQEDVRIEAAALGLDKYAEKIEGALPKSEKCAKEAALRRLVEQAGVKPEELAVIGDGKIEITLGRELGARTIGLATNEGGGGRGATALPTNEGGGGRGATALPTNEGGVAARSRAARNPAKEKRLRAAGAGLIAADFTDLHPLLAYLGLDCNPDFSFRKIRTYDFHDRHNLVTIESMLRPGEDPVPEWPKAKRPGDYADQRADFAELVERVAEARKNARPVIFSMGAHVIKNNLSLYLIDLMEKGIITHLSGNGACSIHDFELAALGGTSEDVPTAIEDGSFGMWEQTGGWMNEALQQGVAAGFGYGESLARYIDAHKRRFPFRDQCVAYRAWQIGIPATYHIALGTDIIHQHPRVDFGAIGTASGRDFHTMVNSVAQLDGGCFLNFGSGVIGPEVFLKALSISRNLGYPTFRITTANFDLKPLGDYRCKIGYADPNYYYRPRKNIVNRPVSCGGKGWHFEGDHKETIPNLWLALHKKGVF